MTEQQPQHLADVAPRLARALADAQGFPPPHVRPAAGRPRATAVVFCRCGVSLTRVRAPMVTDTEIARQ